MKQLSERRIRKGASNKKTTGGPARNWGEMMNIDKYVV